MSEKTSLQLSDALRHQQFADGAIEYRLVAGVVHGTKTISVVRQDWDEEKWKNDPEKYGEVTTDIVREAWIKWNGAELPDTKFIYDAVDGQEVVMCYARAKNNEGKEISEKLWIFNKSTRKNAFVHGMEHGGIVLSAKDNIRKYEFKSPVSRLSGMVRTDEQVKRVRNIKLFQKYGANVSGVLMAMVGYFIGGLWWAVGGVVAGVLFALLLFFVLGMNTKIFLPDESNMTGKWVVDRIEKIREYFGNA